MRYVIATRYFALKTVPLATEDQLHSFSVFCREKENEFNGDPCYYGIEYSEHSYNNDGKRLKIDFRLNWDKTEHDRLYEDATSPFPSRIGSKLEYTLVVIVPDTAHVPPYVLDKMDRYKEMVSQKPAEDTAESEDFKLIESFRIRAESIRDAAPNAGQSTSTNSTTPEFVTSATAVADHPRMTQSAVPPLTIPNKDQRQTDKENLLRCMKKCRTRQPDGKNKKPIAVRDNGVYEDMLRAFVDANHPDEKYKHWVKWKHGIGYMDIAKSEHPEWVEEYGEKVAQQKYVAESEKIRKHVTRIENRRKN